MTDLEQRYTKRDAQQVRYRAARDLIMTAGIVLFAVWLIGKAAGAL